MDRRYSRLIATYPDFLECGLGEDRDLPRRLLSETVFQQGFVRFFNIWVPFDNPENLILTWFQANGYPIQSLAELEKGKMGYTLHLADYSEGGTPTHFYAHDPLGFSLRVRLTCELRNKEYQRSPERLEVTPLEWFLSPLWSDEHNMEYSTIKITDATPIPSRYSVLQERGVKNPTDLEYGPTEDLILTRNPQELYRRAELLMSLYQPILGDGDLTIHHIYFPRYHENYILLWLRTFGYPITSIDQLEKNEHGYFLFLSDPDPDKIIRRYYAQDYVGKGLFIQCSATCNHSVRAKEQIRRDRELSLGRGVHDPASLKDRWSLTAPVCRDWRWLNIRSWEVVPDYQVPLIMFRKGPLMTLPTPPTATPDKASTTPDKAAATPSEASTTVNEA